MSQTFSKNPKVVGCSVRGPGHEEDDLPCQDSWNKTQLSDGSFAIAVGDGLGSASHSDVGSEVATQAAVDHLENFLSGTDVLLEDEGRNAIKKAFIKSRQAVIDEADSREEDVGELETTLLVVAANTSGVVGGVVGDGGIVCCENGSYDPFVPREMSILDIEQQHKTVPLMTENWEDSFRINYKENIDSIALFSDGLDPWAWNGLEDVKKEFFDKVISFVRAIDDIDEAENELYEYLDDEHHRKYKSDDKTLALGVFPKSEESEQSEDRKQTDSREEQHDSQSKTEEKPDSTQNQDLESGGRPQPDTGKGEEAKSRLEANNYNNYFTYIGNLIPGQNIEMKFHAQNKDIGGNWLAVNDSKRMRLDDSGEIEVEIPYSEQLCIGVFSDSVSSNHPKETDNECYFYKVIDLDPTFSIEVTDERAENDDLSVAVEIDEIRTSEVKVYVNDEFCGETDESGVVECELDKTVSTPTIKITKGDINRTREVFLEELNIDLHCWPFTLPFRTAMVKITNDNGDPKESVSVYLQEDKIGNTDEDGKLSFSVPVSMSSKIIAKHDRSESKVTISPIRNLTLLVMIVGVVVLGPLIYLT